MEEWVLTLEKKYAIIAKSQSMFAGVAQSVEHLTRNEKVTCSSHATSSKASVQFGQGLLCYLKRCGKRTSFFYDAYPKARRDGYDLWCDRR